VLVGIGLVIGYWNSILNYWDTWTRPAAGSAVALPGGEEFYCPMHPSVVRDSLDSGAAIANAAASAEASVVDDIRLQ